MKLQRSVKTDRLNANPQSKLYTTVLQLIFAYPVNIELGPVSESLGYSPKFTGIFIHTIPHMSLAF